MRSYASISTPASAGYKKSRPIWARGNIFWLSTASTTSNSSLASRAHRLLRATKKYTTKSKHLFWSALSTCRACNIRLISLGEPLRFARVGLSAPSRAAQARHVVPLLSLSQNNNNNVSFYYFNKSLIYNH
jgi:hypothetical protein